MFTQKLSLSLSLSLSLQRGRVPNLKWEPTIRGAFEKNPRAQSRSSRAQATYVKAQAL
jgi:hypothetical protein